MVRKATVAKYAIVQDEGSKEVKRTIDFFNLDVIFSVGYRVKSKRGTLFRIWANRVLKQYLVQGYTINEKRLSQEIKQLKKLQSSVKLLGDVLESKKLSLDESTGLLRIISDYARAFDLLDQYDYQKLKVRDISKKETFRLTYADAKKQIETAKNIYGNSELFGREKDKSFIH